MLEYGADLKYPIDQKLAIDYANIVRPPVHQAIYSSTIGMLQLLFDHGVSPNQEPVLMDIGDISVFGETHTPLAWACSRSKEHMVEYLLLQGACPNSPCGYIDEYKVKRSGEKNSIVTLPNVVWFLAASGWLS